MMKKLLFIPALALFLFSCSDSDECHECHIAFDNVDGTETMWEIQAPSGDDEFCGSELETVEDPSYMHNVSAPLISSDGNDTLQAGEYGSSNGYEIHCEEHADHDH